MKKIAILGDLHFGARDGNKAIREHQNDFLHNQFIPYCNKNGINLVIQTGDFFDNRTALRHQSIYDAKHFAYQLEEHGIKMIVLVGNHDLVNKSDNDFDAVNAILGQYSMVECVDSPTEFKALDMLIVPWISKANHAEVMDKIKSSTMYYLVGHFDILGAKFSKYGMSSHDGIDPKEFKKFDKVISGHFHTKSTMGNVEYVGTPYEMNWSDWDDQKGFHVFEPETGTLEFIKNESKLFYKIYHGIDNEIKIVPETENLDFSGKFVKVETSSTDKKAIKSTLGKYGAGAVDVQTTMINVESSGIIKELKVNSVSTMIEDSVKSVRKDRSEGVLTILKSAMEKVNNL
jgi:DNA repair exonuclease SbcCD nuclease subunit